MADKELVFRFSEEGLDTIAQRLEQMVAGAGRGAGAASAGSPAPAAASAGGAAPVSGQGLSAAQRASSNGAGAGPAAPLPGGFTITDVGGGQSEVKNSLGRSLGTFDTPTAYELGSFLTGQKLTPPAPASGAGHQAASQAAAASQINVPGAFHPYSVQQAGGRMFVVDPSGAQVAAGITPQGAYQAAQQMNLAAFTGQSPMPVPADAQSFDWRGFGRGLIGMQAIAGGAYILGAGITQNAAQLGQTYAGYRGALAAGHTVYPESAAAGYIKPSLTLGAIAAGMAIGTAIMPGPGTVIGGLIGMGAGFIGGSAAEAYFTPGLDALAQIREIQATYRAFGGSSGLANEEYELLNSAGMRDLAGRMAGSGMYSPSTLRLFGRRDAQGNLQIPEHLAKQLVPALIQGSFDPTLFGLYGYGIPAEGREGAIAQHRKIAAAAAISGDYDNPAIQWKGLGNFAENLASARLSQTYAGFGQARAAAAYQSAALSGGFAGSEAAFSSYGAHARSSIRAIDEEINELEANNATWHPRYHQLLAERQAKQTEFQSAAYARTDLAIGDTSARYGLRQSRAERAFAKQLFGGVSAAALPWQQRASAMLGEATALEELVRTQPMSPARAFELTRQAEELRTQATLDLPRQREQSILAQSEAAFGARQAELQSANVPAQMLGGPQSRYGAAQSEIGLLRERQQQLQEELDTAKLLTAEERSRKQEQISQLQIAERRLAIGAELARIEGVYSHSMLLAAETGQPARIASIRGVGGLAALPYMRMTEDEARQGVAAVQTKIADLRRQGVEETSDIMDDAKRQLMQAQLGLEQTIRGQAVLPVSPEMIARRSNLDTALQIGRTTFAGFGDIRGMLSQQQRVSQSRISELNANRARLQREGKWTPGMEADFTQARNQELLRAASAQAQLEEGWIDRLVQRSWNAPGSFSMIASQFTQREMGQFAGLSASLMTPFGGGKEASDYAKFGRAKRVASMIGMLGNQSGFMETAMNAASNADVSGAVTLDITIRQEGKSPTSSTHQIPLRAGSAPFDAQTIKLEIGGGGRHQ